MFQLTQPAGYFQRTLLSSPKSLCCVCVVHVLDTLGHICSFGLGGLGIALRFKCRHSYKNHQESSWHICSMTLVQTRKGHLRPGYSLQGEARPWLLKHWTCCRKCGVCTWCVRWPSNRSRYIVPEDEVGIMWTTRDLGSTKSLTSRTATKEVAWTSNV